VNGLAGDKGEKGDKGDTGATGITFVAPVVPITGGTVLLQNGPAGLPYVFLSPVTGASAKLGQKIVASVTLTATPNASGTLSFAPCVKGVNSTVTLPFGGLQATNRAAYTAGEVSSFTASGAWTVTQTGTYEIGLCAASSGVGTGALDEVVTFATELTNGFVLVTSSQ
jgi:hypothetical protein